VIDVNSEPQGSHCPKSEQKFASSQGTAVSKPRDFTGQLGEFLAKSPKTDQLCMPSGSALPDRNNGAR
jgi:hypothetical protein